MFSVHQLEVRLHGGHGFDPATATVRLVGDGLVEQAVWDGKRRLFYASGLPHLAVRVVASSPGWLPREGRVELGAGSEVVVLVLERDPSLPGPYDGLIGVVAAPGADALTALDDAGWQVVSSEVDGAIVAERPGLSRIDESLINGLRTQPAIARAGRVIWFPGDELAFESGFVHVRLAPEVGLRHREALFRRHGVELVRPSFGVNAFLVSVTDLSRTPAVVARGVAGEGEVLASEPEAVRFSRDDSANAPLFAGCWDRSLAGVDSAWTSLGNGGDTDLLLGVVDKGLRTENGATLHPAFVGNAGSSSKAKVAQLYDFDNDVDHHDNAVNNHGLMVAGVAVGAGDQGAPGVAPDVRLISAIAATGTNEEILAPFWWMARRYDLATLPATLSTASARDVGEEAGVVVTSQSFFAGSALPDVAAAMVEHVARCGRGGRGQLLLASAGTWDANPDDAEHVDVGRPLGAHPRALSVAATMLKAQVEYRADYAGYGADLAAPSHTHYAGTGNRHEPPLYHAVWAPVQRTQGYLSAVSPTSAKVTAATVAGDKKSAELTLDDVTHTPPNTWLHLGGFGDGAGTSPAAGAWSQVVRVDDLTGQVVKVTPLGSTELQSGTIAVNTAVQPSVVRIGGLTSDVSYDGATVWPLTVHVDSTTGLQANDLVMLEAFLAFSATKPAYRVSQVVSGTELKLDEPDGAGSTRTVASGGSLYRIESHYSPGFGGTSAAAPFVAGAAALVLSAEPELTWAEVAWILAKTAARPSLSGSYQHNSRPDITWLDRSGSSASTPADRWWSEAIGHGRVDVGQAVTLALDWKNGNTGPNIPGRPDLWIRSKVGDPGDGTGVSEHDETPDVWVSDQPPASSPTTHVQPTYGKRLWIYARVRNRGTGRSLKAAWARFYVCAKALHPFPFDTGPNTASAERAWETDNSGKTSNVVFAPESYFLAEKAIPSIAAGGDHVVAIRWPKGLRPPPKDHNGLPFSPCLLVEVTPQDGGVVSPNIEENHHLAWRSITITDDSPPLVEFLQHGTDQGYGRTEEVAPSATASVQLDVRLSDPSELDVDAVVFRITWRLRDGTTDTRDWVKGTGGWAGPSGTFGANVADPTLDTGGPASGAVPAARFALEIEADGSVETLSIFVAASDTAGHATSGAAARHTMRIVIPVDVALALDWSGSMGMTDLSGRTRWASASDAANLYHHVFRSLIDGSSLDHRIALVRFWTSGGVDKTEVTSALAAPTSSDLVSSGLPAATQMTPTGSGLLTAAGELAGTDWRDRQVLLVSDGHENQSPTLAQIRLATTGGSYVPRRADAAAAGLRVHTLAVGDSADVAVDALQALAEGGDSIPRSYAGQFHATESTDAPSEAHALKLHLLSLVADSLGANLVPFSSSAPVSFDVEHGVDRMVCVVTDAQAFELVAPGGTKTTATTLASSGLAVASVSAPAAGTWLVDGFAASSTAEGFAVVDLALRADFEVRVAGGSLQLTAVVTEDGEPVSGAVVTADVRGPQDVIGTLLMQFVQGPRFSLAQWQALATAPTTHDMRLGLRAELLVEALGGASLQLADQPVTLAETSPGTYEATVSAPNEGTWAVRFEATGEDSGAAPFRRIYHASVYRPPVPDQGQSQVQITQLGPVNGGASLLWEAVFTPADELGRLLGPGLADRLAAFAGGQPSAVEDLFDGTYRARFALPPGALVGTPTLSLTTHSPAPAAVLGAPVLVAVTLLEVEILDDMESRLPSPGELKLTCTVTRRSDGQAWVTELPARPTQLVQPNGAWTAWKRFEKLSDGDTLTRYKRLFEETVDPLDELELRFEATEHDLLFGLVFDRDPYPACTDVLAAPQVPGTTIRQLSAAGWRVTYRVAVS